MAKLILVNEGAVIKDFTLDKERTTIGRKPNNDIQLDDPTVSGQHAVVLNLQNVYVEDLGSTNGTLLNGHRINKRMLNHGDVIRIGRHEFKFVDQSAQDFDKTVVIAPASVEPLVAAAAPSTAPGPQAPAAEGQPVSAPAAVGKRGSALVKVVSGPKSGQNIPLNKPYTTLGSPGVQVAVIARRGTAYYLMPMGGIGKQGEPPRLNDQVVGSQTLLLKEGDVIEVAGSRLQFSQAG